MPIDPYFIVGTLITMLFSVFLFYFGLSLFKTKSIMGELEKYRKNPKQANFYQKFLLGFGVGNGKTTEWSVKAFGDKPLTLWYRFSGILFMIFSVLIAASSIFLPVMFFLDR